MSLIQAMEHLDIDYELSVSCKWEAQWRTADYLNDKLVWKQLAQRLMWNSRRLGCQLHADLSDLARERSHACSINSRLFDRESYEQCLSAHQSQ